MDAMTVVKHLKEWGPVLFALGFLAPLIAQSLERANVAAPAELSSLELGLMVSLPLGLAAKRWGRWL